MPAAEWIFLSPAVAGNLCGLAGTALLAWGALRAIPIATALYRISSDQDALERQRLAIEEAAERELWTRPEPSSRQEQPKPGGLADEHVPPELADRLRKSIEATREALDQTARELASIRDRWRRRDTVLTLAGLVLTLASDALPLLALFSG